MKNLFTILFISVLSVMALAQSPLNDACIDAIEIDDPRSDCGFRDFKGATFDFMDPACGLDSMRNIWFKFTAIATALKIEAYLMDGSRAFIQVYQFIGEPCESFQAKKIACAHDKLELNNLLTAGEEYYFSISAYDNAESNQIAMCMFNTPTNSGSPNDELCHAIHIKADSSCVNGTLLNATYDTNNPSCTNPDERSVWYKFLMPKDVKAMEIDFTPISLNQEAYSIGVYELQPGEDCYDKPTFLKGYCGHGRDKFSVYGLVPEKRYYIMVSSKEETGNTFKICLNPIISPPGCAENEFCEDAEEIVLRVDDSYYCFTGCNIGATVGPFDSTRYCAEFPNPSVFYKLYVDSFMHQINININSGDFYVPQLAVFYGDCDELTFVKCDLGNRGELKMTFRPDVLDTTYYFVISDAMGSVGHFEFCIEAENDNYFCNENYSLEVVHASLGSPLEGPYRSGEELHFRYTVSNWHPTKCNWIQGIVPDFMVGWDTKSFDADGELRVKVKSPEAYSDGKWDWYKAGEAHYNLENPVKGYEKGKETSPGWYFMENSVEELDSSRGDGALCDDIHYFEWVVEFKARLTPYPHCTPDSLYYAILQIMTLSDGEIGNRDMAACLTDLKSTFRVPFTCCPGPIIEMYTDTICSGETVNLNFAASDSIELYRWSVFPGDYVEGATHGYGQSINQTLVNNSYETQIVEYTVYAMDTSNCYGPPNFYQVTVLPKLDINAGPDEVLICRDHEFVLGGNPTAQGGRKPYSYRWNEQGLRGANPVISPSESRDWALLLTDANGCSLRDTVHVAVTDSPLALVPDDIEICRGDSTLIEIELVGKPPFTFNPSFNGMHLGSRTTSERHHSFQFLGASTTVFKVDSLADAVCATEAENSMKVIVRESITVNLNAFICGDEVFSLNNRFYDETGVYEIHMPGANRYGCDSTIILNLTANENIRLRDTIIYFDEEKKTGNIAVVAEGGTPPYRFNWSNGDKQRYIIDVPAGDYSVTVTDSKDCDREFTFVLVDPKTATENPVTPDFVMYPQPVKAGNDINLSLKSLEPGIYSFDLYSSRGEKISTESFNYNSQSTVFKRKMESAGVFYWHIVKEGRIILTGKCVVI